MFGEGKSVLVTGGAGYIGTHTVVVLVEAGYKPVIVDNLDNASLKAVQAVEELVGQSIPFYQVDLCDKQALEDVFQKHKFDSVIHFAGYKAVGESMQYPMMYYHNNLIGAIHLFECLKKYNVKNVVFSSSCTVYGNAEYLPIDENHPTGKCTNPYGRTKYFIEQILIDLCKTDKTWNVILLRYFNPCGAHKTGKIGEDPNGIPNQLMPYVAQVAVGRRTHLTVYGNDYNTKDGTGVRDYIHVVDLAKGHELACKKLAENCGLKIYNLGTGTGYSVMEMINAFEKASGKTIAYEVAQRRLGDAEQIYADPSLAAEELGWKCELGLDDMCADLWRWQTMNPNGYENRADVNYVDKAEFK